MASGKMVKVGANRNPKQNPGMDFHSGLRKNPGIDFYSGFRKTSQGGGAL